MRIILTEVYDNYSAATVLFLFPEMISEDPGGFLCMMCSDALIRLLCMKTRFHTEGNGDYKWIAKQLFSMSSRQDGL